MRAFKHLGTRTKGDKVIWAIVVLLALMSLLAVYSSTGSLAYKMYKGNTEIYLFKQFAFIIVGVVIIYFAHQVNYIIYSKCCKDPIPGFHSTIILYIIFWSETE